jgi:hypothetical protein
MLDRTYHPIGPAILAGALSSLSLAACNEPTSTGRSPDRSPPAPSSAVSTLRSRVRGPVDLRQPVGLDKLFFDIAGDVPGFAGVYIERGRVVVRKTRPVALGAVARNRIVTHLERGIGRRLTVARVVPSAYDFRQLHLWKGLLLTEPPEVGMTRAGVCVQLNQVCIGVRPGARAALLEKARRLGVPSAALSVYDAEPVELTGAAGPRSSGALTSVGPRSFFPNLAAAPTTMTHAALTFTFVAPSAGVRVHNLLACTLGFNGVNVVGERALVTASHCVREYGNISFAQVGQPDSSTRRVGEENYEPATFACVVGGVNRPNCRYSDATEVLYDPQIDWALGRIARPAFENQVNNRIDDINPEFIISSTNPVGGVIAGDIVHRIGSESGWHNGPVLQPCQNVVTTIQGRDIWLLCQTEVNALVRVGDSGGPVFRRLTGQGENVVQMVGVQWGGGATFWYSGMDRITGEVQGDGFGAYQLTP